MLLRSFTVLLLLLALAGCGKPPYSSIDNAQLQTMLDDGVPAYDVRRAEEWRQTGVVNGSRTLTWVDGRGQVNPEFLPRLTAEVDKNAPVILICHSGSRSATLARELMETHGYTRVYNLTHGIAGWIGEKLPVVRN